MSPSNTLFNKTYDFHLGNDNGDLWGVTDGLDTLGLNRPHGSVQYNYDAMNRVISAQTLGTDCTQVAGGTRDWGESFTVDPWGNLTAKTPTKCSADPLSTSTNNRNQLLAATYDSAGNAVQNNGINFTFDAAGRIVTAAGSTYIYDGSGERVQKPGKLYWRGSGSDALAETSTTDTNPTFYIFFGGKRIARLDPGASTPKYYVEDNVGSTALVTDYLGNKLSESLFFPYGIEQQVLTGDSNTYKFTGKERDAESGLDDFGARFYAANLGRFMSPDWDAKPTAVPYATFGDPQTLNLYAYVENAPLNRVDADGHAAFSGEASNPWRALYGVEDLYAWHAYCLGSGWFPNDGLRQGDTPLETILAAFALQDAEKSLKSAQESAKAQQQLSSQTLSALGLSTDLHVTAQEVVAGVLAQEFRGEGTDAAQAGAVIVLNRTLQDLANDDKASQWGRGGVSQAGLSNADNAMLKIISAPNQFDALTKNPSHISSILAGGANSSEYGAALGKLWSVSIGASSLGNYGRVGNIDIGRRENFVANWSGRTRHDGILVNHTEFY